MKHHHLPLSIDRLPSFITQQLMLILFVVIGFSTNAVAQTDLTLADTDAILIAANDTEAAQTTDQVKKAKKGKKYTGPMPVAAANSHNGSLIPVGSYVYNNKYFNVTKDQYYSGTNKVAFADSGLPMREFSYQDLQTIFRAGVMKNVDVRVLFSTIEKNLYRMTSEGMIKDTTSGLADTKIIGRYGILNQKTGPFNLIAGIGVTIPTGSTDEKGNNGLLLPASMQLGSGSWNPIFEIGMHKVVKRHWLSAYFTYVLATEGDLGPHDFTRSNVFKYTFAYNYAISRLFDLGIELNGDVFSRAELNGVKQDITGGHTVFLSPQIHWKFSKSMHLDLCVPIPVYHDLNGPQLGIESMVVAKFAWKF